jgi:hypothetical protein
MLTAQMPVPIHPHHWHLWSIVEKHSLSCGADNGYIWPDADLVQVRLFRIRIRSYISLCVCGL